MNPTRKRRLIAVSKAPRPSIRSLPARPSNTSAVFMAVVLPRSVSPNCDPEIELTPPVITTVPPPRLKAPPPRYWANPLINPTAAEAPNVDR